jgi:hypothetical protein
MYKMAFSRARAVMLVLCIALLGACTTVSKPLVVILSPPSGSQFYENEDVAIQSTSADPQGVVRVELLVDGNVVRVDPSPTPQGQTHFTLVQTWKATAGTHTIVVRAYNVAGMVSDPIAVSVNVVQRTAQAPTPTLIPVLPSPTPFPYATKPPIAPSPTSTPTPSPTSSPPTVPPPTEAPPTETPPLPPCSGTPVISSFAGSPTTITAGNSATLTWGVVTNADYVEIDHGIGGVAAPGSIAVSPPATTTYTMYAHCGAEVATRQVTINVTPASPPPTDAPAAPSSFSATGNGTTIQFTWVDNSTNEAGFRIYQVGSVAPVVAVGANTGTGGMSYNWTGRPCNLHASFYVRAYNAAGESAPSATASAVTIPCAPTGLTASAASQTAVNLSFTDNATNESGFRVYRSGVSRPMATLVPRLGTGTKTGTVGSIPCGTQYSYYVRAYNSAGESSSSNTVSATTNACTITVNFTSVLVHNDSDSDASTCLVNCGKGEVWLEFTVNGQNKRWPPTGHIEIGSGETKAISGIVYSFDLLRSQSLSITVKGREEDSWSPDDNLGTVTASYTGSTTWGEGNHCTESASPNYFRICYTISVAP